MSPPRRPQTGCGLRPVICLRHMDVSGRVRRELFLNYRAERFMLWHKKNRLQRYKPPGRSASCKPAGTHRMAGYFTVFLPGLRRSRRTSPHMETRNIHMQNSNEKTLSTARLQRSASRGTPAPRSFGHTPRKNPYYFNGNLPHHRCSMVAPDYNTKNKGVCQAFFQTFSKKYRFFLFCRQSAGLTRRRDTGIMIVCFQVQRGGRAMLSFAGPSLRAVAMPPV